MPVPLLIGFLVVVVAITAGIAIAPRRVLNILFFLGQDAVRQASPEYLQALRVLAALIAAGLVFLLIRWGFTGVAP